MVAAKKVTFFVGIVDGSDVQVLVKKLQETCPSLTLCNILSLVGAILCEAEEAEAKKVFGPELNQLPAELTSVALYVEPNRRVRFC